MSAARSLSALRREIDAIDGAIHELLMDRADVVTRIRRLKSEAGIMLRPGREAEIIRGLVDRHRGPLTKGHLVRIWREILAASIGLQGPFSVAVYEPDAECGFGDLGRDQFGLVTPMTVYRSRGQVIDAVVRGSAAVGILPLPFRDEKEPWWPHLLSEEPGAPQIVARLPFAGHGNGRGGALEALVIGRIAFEPTGRDRTFLAIEVEGEISLSSLGPVLAGEDLAPAFTALWSPEHTPGASLYLAEVDDFVAAKDRRLPRLVQALDAPVRRVLVLGGYAVPLGAEELAPPPGGATGIRGLHGGSVATGREPGAASLSTLVARPGIAGIDPYVGGESAIAGRDRVVKLASNEGALGPSPKAVAAYIEAAKSMHRYPDGECGALRSALGERYGLERERIVCGAGSDELLSLLCRAYAGPGDEVLYSEHGFLIFPIAARASGATPLTAPEARRTVDVDAILARVSEKTRVVFIANPNNPTGTYLSAAEMRRLKDGLSDSVLLVVDAAYAEYVDRDDYEPGIELVDSAATVVMTRTFSKIHALGGLRLGWCYGPPTVIDVLNRLRLPFNVSRAAQAAGLAALADVAFTEKSRRHNATWRAWLTERLRAIGLIVGDSVCNFVLVQFPEAPGRDAEAADAFLKARGLIGRRLAGYGLPGCLRITIGRADEMRAVADALGEFVG